MNNRNNLDKLKELTTRAVSINENLLKEEKRFIKATTPDADLHDLKKMHDQIVVLIRKEKIYTEAAHSLLNKMLNK